MQPAATPAPAAPPARWYRHLYVQVLAAIIAGIVLGHVAPATGAALKPLGDAFIALVKMVIPPVIFLTIVTGIAGLRDLAEVGRIAAMALGYFLVLSTGALLVGLAVGNLVRPGAGLNIDPATLDSGKVADYAAKAHDATITGFLSGIIPDTFVSALTEGNVLQVLLVAILFGLALSLSGEPGRRLLPVLENLSQVFFRVVALVMKAAPMGGLRGDGLPPSASMGSAPWPISPGWSPPSISPRCCSCWSCLAPWRGWRGSRSCG